MPAWKGWVSTVQGASCYLAHAVLTACALVVLALAPVQAENPPLDEKRVQELIREFIDQNPKLIYETVNRYLLELQRASQEEQRKYQNAQIEASFRKRLEIPADPASPVLGPAEAPLTVVAFTDFQCPFCAKGNKVIQDLLKRYEGKIRLVFRNNPLPFHEEGFAAAKAALAAHRQGKFWEYHNLLFERGGHLTPDVYPEIAAFLELDMALFNTERESAAVLAQIKGDMALAESKGLGSTPTYVVNGVLIVGAQPVEYFSQVMDRLLTEQ